MSTHSQFSPSSAHRWMRCAAAIAMENGLPDSSSAFADEGTAAHELAAMALSAKADAAAYLGRVIEVNGRKFEVDFEMADNVQVYIDRVREYADGHELLVEQRVDFSNAIGQPDSSGTSDVVIITADEIQVHDLKYGRGVRVDADENEQLMLYGVGALNEYGLLGDFKTVRMLIHQPRLGHLSEWSCSVEDLEKFAEKAKAAAALSLTALQFKNNWVRQPDAGYFAPGPKQCMWCKAQATCPALAKHVLETVADEFVDLDAPLEPQLAPGVEKVRLLDNEALAEKLKAADMIEKWVESVRAKVAAELHAGRQVPDFKLVQGRRGSRDWEDKSEAEKTLKSMRLKEAEMYDFKLISPTTAEKLAKAGTIGVKQWPKLQKMITQAEGKPSVAPASDKRPALVVTAVVDEFDVVAEVVEDTADDLV